MAAAGGTLMTVLGIAGMGAKAVGSVAQGIGDARANQSEADKSVLAWRVGEVQADQIDASYRNELDATLRNIRAIQASSGVAAGSPSGDAVAAVEAEASDRDRRVAVASARLQSNQSLADSFMFRRAARWSLFGGVLGGLGSLAGAGSLRPQET